MNSFSALSEVYDSFNENADYQVYVNFILDRFSRHCNVSPDYQPRAVDLGCGTGEMSLSLAIHGFDVIGVDHSYEMLGQAMDKLADYPELALFFIRQDMRRLQMDAKANLFISCYDCLNYLDSEEELRATFEGVSESMVSGGLFIFDVNSLYRFERFYGNNTFVFKKTNQVLVWENHYNKEKQVSHFDIEIFQKEKSLYRRSREKLKQSYFSPETILRSLESCGFEKTEEISDCELWNREGEALRTVYVCKKK